MANCHCLVSLGVIGTKIDRSGGGRYGLNFPCGSKRLPARQCLPNAHFDVSMQALKSGRHVFSEKPFAVFSERIVTAAGPMQGKGIKVEAPTTHFAVRERDNGALVSCNLTRRRRWRGKAPGWRGRNFRPAPCIPSKTGLTIQLGSNSFKPKGFGHVVPFAGLDGD